ncbi:hypothetical protein GCM10027278_21420 [Paralcaligenes ginsengisoli]
MREAEEHQIAVFASHPATGSLALMGRYAVGEQPSWIEIVPAPAKGPARHSSN